MIRTLLLSLFLFITACTPAQDIPFDGLEIAMRDAPTADFLNASDTKTNLKDYGGEVLLLNYWATWCGPCEEELPSLGKLHEKFSGQGFRVIALSVDDSADMDYARNRLALLSGDALAFHRLQPDDWQIYYQSGARGFPTSLLIDREGKEIARLEGSTDWYSDDAQRYIRSVLQNN